jgi:hypothetical protein
MKKLTLLLMLSVSTAYGQITVNERPKAEKLYSNPMGFYTLYKDVYPDSSVMYSIIFKDCQYKQLISYKSVMFSSKQDIQDFFNIIVSVIETKESKSLSFANQDILLIHTKGGAKMYLGDSFCWWTVKWIEKCLENIH